ncbi:MAG: 3-deoxy-8-phosphooctulonate synthase [Bacteroidales bacterium]|nr:3-deoxy-8-phosphooctulonate synthase [Bacteroidales bacterium]
MPLFQEILKNNKNSFFLIAGPCVVESYDNVSQIAETLKELCSKMNIPFIFKASYRKANRSKSSSFTGLGDDIALKILDDIKGNFDLPICTDFHSAQEAEMAAQVADIIQVPAFLCRQTDILHAAGETKKIVNIKKGQFLSPESMGFATEKLAETGNKKIMLTERGTSFGYTDLIVDFRGIPSMKSFGYPVVLDVTHSLQQPNQTTGVSGGRPEMIATIAKAGIAAGVNGIFLETHPKPSKALSDGANMLQLDKVEKLLVDLLRIYHAV